MLNTHRAIANLAVHDIDHARRFYEGVLGLQPVDSEGDELVSYRSGDTVVNVYRSKYAGTNQATAVTWVVGDALDDEVAALKAKGVRFEHYDMPGLERQGDIYGGGDMRVAWFKDPDGNILNLVTG
ncbi:VOC family protein [Aquincola sp. S2]|uniref:VOC family protein n=1 Tax=Pseudaquabacterium terrae TaxID=2732868 RepID=A0ABX2EHZ7_9BURK|nr:VOC family protein [Aquabacterium terrae]NRF68233.1 VOC family protein [Aquabacterium terrae]